MARLPPDKLLALLLAALVVLMGTGLFLMARSGPPRGQLYALLHQPHR